jgi:hypothetical protein
MLSVAVAVVMSVVALRIAREERRRSEARVRALAADIHDIHDEQSSPVVVSDLFLAAAHSRPPSPLLAALAVGVLVVGSAIGALVLLTGGGRAPSATGVQPATTSQPALELATLDHERNGDRLIVRGVVRNRNETSFRDPITVVVSVLDRGGAVVATGRGPVEIAAEPGGSGVESSFVVTIAGVTEVDRYRVRFSTDDRTLAHVDRRNQTATAELR